MFSQYAEHCTESVDVAGDAALDDVAKNTDQRDSVEMFDSVDPAQDFHLFSPSSGYQENPAWGMRRTNGSTPLVRHPISCS